MRTLSNLLLSIVFVLLPISSMADSNTDPEVSIVQKEDKTISEYRMNGFLYAIKVQPKNAPAYFLVRADGSDANFVRTDDPDMLIPSWQIFSW